MAGGGLAGDESELSRAPRELLDQLRRRPPGTADTCHDAWPREWGTNFDHLSYAR